MQWVYVVLVLTALLAVVRVVLALRKARSQSTHDDWDARLVKNLRAAGGNSFTPYEVDFFFSVPDQAAAESLRGTLESEGFAIDARIMSGEGASGYSLQARKHLRISVSEMQGFSQRFRALAQQYGGYYDGWMTDPSRK
ncbi:MAG TPA: ribonuclease E inhibitor RraB [Steroidobacteraceae bacterium]|nr:ribonuclease E inhibitor RraB [Steroidobacteraceae bacterium]